ncbi:cell division FtsA domain-containing protein [Petrotoga sp. 9PWA.NaAc.5.4]|uniref:cell division FtsA domain-containing protein n=1 Tax=Petrotoga sp. 9PWA.NaAc.5.4 TaxID=1434328 RepID=UPI000CB8C800|nr:cell division FtsA domain-containing protein [Petrotoga sp. 9PWA.NaAc.5.4]PNR93672.1 cell division protein FtsA [Petrotoga sp. 9PWA.NaAc.5.4]
MIFGLDIGTRTLVGILADYDEENEKIVIRDFYELEHENRAMLDGQIHDVGKVAKSVNKVKQMLEEKSGEKLSEVAIAIAGRFLISSIGTYELDISTQGFLSEDIVRNMELEAVKLATEKIQYYESMYCVGYSVLYYSLDGQWIKHLEGQKGNQAKVKVLAAFLPRNVVEAMMSVLERSGLKPFHITLEPIAATSLVVPEDLRSLNIVMVDVGAGTSDIAISNNGVIIGYGMVPLAGDEITEAISESLLVDFKVAEKIKRELSEKETITYKDILDNSQEISKEEVLKIINPTIDNIADKIVKEIINLNGRSPSAVMVVGGGGKVPGFIEKIAEKLQIPKSRVSLKTASNLEKIVFECLKLEGSEYVTPLGIVNVALKKEGSVFNNIKINHQNFNILFMGKDMNVLQVLLQAGYSMDRLVGAPSPAIGFELNGKLMIVKGEKGRTAKIRINGDIADFNSPVKPGDKIEIEEPENGGPVSLTIKQVITPIKYYLNGEPKITYPIVFKNGKKVEDLEEKIKDGEIIQTVSPTIEDIFKNSNEKIYFTINNLPYEVSVGTVIVKNGEILEKDYKIKNEDSLETKAIELPKLKDFLNIEIEKTKVFLNGKEILLNKEEFNVMFDGRVINIEEEIMNGANYTIKKVQKDLQLIDIFNHLSLNVNEIKSYEIYINGEKVESFLQKINPGADVKVLIND